MTKSKIIFIIFILLLPAVFAETKIYSDNVITDTDKVIEGGIFKFRYDEYANKVFVQTPTTNLIVDNGACKSNAVFKVCINKANFSHRNITTYQNYYEVNVDIYKLTGSLTAVSKFTLTELLPNEETDFTITITNPTDFEITNIKFSQGFSPFYLREVKGCSLNGDSLEWQGSFKPKYDKICSAKISADKEGTYTLAGNLSYFNSYETEKKTTDSITIIVMPRQLKIIKTLDIYTEINNPFYFNVSLQNINTIEKIEGSLTYEFPGYINIIKMPSGFTKDLNVIKRILSLAGGTVLNFSFYLEPVSEGVYSIHEKYKYTLKNVDDIIENSTPISTIEPKPEIDLISEYQQVKPGQKFIVLVKLTNPSRFYDLTNIKSRLNVPFNNEVIESLSKLTPNQSYTIISNTFVVPEYLDPQKTNNFNLELVVEYSLREIPKSINKSLAIKLDSLIPQEPAIIEPQPTANQSEITTEAQTAPVVQQETDSNQSQQEFNLVEIIEEALPLKKFKVDFSDKILWVVMGIILIIILIVPAIIYNIKKKKRLQVQQPQTPQQQENIK